MKRVLLIAFHYPPVLGSSGLQRVVANARYLRDYGWEPTVLTVSPRAYRSVSDEQLRASRSGVCSGQRTASFGGRILPPHVGAAGPRGELVVRRYADGAAVDTAITPARYLEYLSNRDGALDRTHAA